MSAWVALLRGINVGTAKRVAMGDLRALLEALGYGDVRTLLQSGQAVFAAKTEAKADALERAIEKQIASELSMEVAVLVRNDREWNAMVEANPFAGRGHDPKMVGATFLSTAVTAGAISAVDRDAVAPDEFALGKRVIYTYQPQGVRGTKLPNWEKALGVRATARNWNTVIKIRDALGS